MTVTELVQLYAPLAGMLAMIFWLGMLSERVKTVAAALAELRSENTVAEAPAVIRLESKVEAMSSSVDKLTRGMEGVQRQLGNMMKSSGKVVELHSDGQ